MVFCIGKQKCFCIPLLITTLIVCYSACILPTADRVANLPVLTIIFSAMIFLFVYVMAFAFIVDIIKSPSEYSGVGMVVGVIDVGFSLIHVLALIMYCIVVSRPTSNDFSGLPSNATGYDLYWTYCLSNTIGLFFSAGITNSAALTPLAVVHNNFSIITGGFINLVVLALAVSRLQSRRLRVSRKVNI